MQIERLDHLVLTVRDPDATVAFYAAIGFPHTTFGDGRRALHVGPVDRTGAVGPLRSVDVRDPDRTLVELSALVSRAG